MTTLFVDGVNQGDGVCIRMNKNGSTSNFFVSPVSSKDVACGREKSTVPYFCSLNIETDKQKESMEKSASQESVQPRPRRS